MLRTGGGLRFTRDASTWRGRVRVFLVAAALIHLLLALIVVEVAPPLPPPPPSDEPKFVMVQIPEEARPASDPLAEQPTPEELLEMMPNRELDGQIVELPEPDVEQRPDLADYLAEYDVTVDKETRSKRFTINPEVLAPQWSEEMRKKQAEARAEGTPDAVQGREDGQPEASELAKEATERKPPADRGTRPSLPSPWALSSKQGFEQATVGEGGTGELSGAPQNDLLNEELGDRVALNAKENLYAGYLNRIRRLVNYYWDQNLKNLPSGLALAKSAYATSVEVVLDGTGTLAVIEVVRPSGSPEIDDCVVRAFRMAGPFPNPPEGLIEKDGRVYLPGMTFDVRLGQAKMNYGGVDPRSNVQFPGLMKSPY